MKVTLVDSSTTVSPRDRGLHYGDGFFTTARIENGAIVFWQDHVQRLIDSANRLHFPSLDINTIESHFNRLPQSGVIKILITRGEGQRGYAVPNNSSSQCFLFVTEQSNPAELQRINVTYCKTPISINSALAGIKHNQKLEQVLAQQELKGTDFREGLMGCESAGEGGVNKINHWICATHHNFFLAIDNCIVTPIIERAGVEGIMRKNVMRWLKQNDVTVKECHVTKDMIDNADEMFLTNSVKGIQSVASVENKTFHEFDYASSLYQQFLTECKVN